jgi:hypothetical protein
LDDRNPDLLAGARQPHPSATFALPRARRYLTTFSITPVIVGLADLIFEADLRASAALAAGHLIGEQEVAERRVLRASLVANSGTRCSCTRGDARRKPVHQLARRER